MRVLKLRKKLARILHLINAEVEMVDTLVVDPEAGVITAAVGAMC